MLLTAMTGALARYLRDRGEALSGVDLRALIPISLRPAGAEVELGNRIGIVFLMVGFGASFGYTVMGRISLLVGRITFLFRDWLGLIS